MRYRIGWKKNNVWHYIFVDSKAEVLEEVADKMILSDSVSVKACRTVDLRKEKRNG